MNANLITVALVVLLLSCSQEKQYYKWKIELTYVNGDKEIKEIIGCTPLGNPYLNDTGCVRTTNDGSYPCFQLISCGVRNLKILSKERWR